MRTLSFEQMASTNGGGWRCLASIALTSIAYAGYVSAGILITAGTAGAGALFLIAGAGFITSFAGTADSCGW